MKNIKLRGLLAVSFAICLLVSITFAGSAAGDTIKIGFFSPLSGFAAADGRSALYGAQIAVDFINENGGVNGKKVELVNYDDAAQSDQASSIARKLITKDKIDIGVSGSYSTPTRAAAGIFQSSGVLLISSYAVHPSILEVGNLISRVGMGAPVQGAAGAILAVKELGAERVAVLTMNNDFGVALSKYFKEKAKELGAKIVFDKKYPLGETEFRGMLGSVKDAKPDLIWAPGYFSEGAHLVKQANELDIHQQIIGTEGYDSPKFIELGGKATNGTIIITDLDRGSEREIVQRFLAEYKERAGIPGDMVGASSFDAVKVAAYAIEKADSTNPDEVMKVINNIENLEDMVTGPFYDFVNKEAIRPIGVQIVRGGEFHRFMKMTSEDIIHPPEE